MSASRSPAGKPALDPLEGKLGAQALPRLLRYLAPQKGTLALASLLTLVYSAINLGYGSVAGKFVDLLHAHAGKGAEGRLGQYLLLGLAVLAVKSVLYVVSNYSWTLASQQLSRRLRTDLFAHLQRLSPSFYTQHKTGQVMSCLTNDVAAAVTSVAYLQDSAQAAATLAGGVGLLFWINWPLALLCCLVMPPVAFLVSRGTRKARTYSIRLQKARARLLDVAQESLSGARIVKAFANEKYEKRRFYERSREQMRVMLAQVRLRFAFTQGTELLGVTSSFLVLYVGVWQVVNRPDLLTLGSLIWFVLVMRQVVDGVRDVGLIFMGVSQTAVGADRVFTLLDRPSDIRDAPDAVELPRGEGRLAFENVRFAYRAGIPVLDGISFTVRPGEVVAVVGPTGAGKSTIASLIVRFYDVTGGAVRIDGVDVRECTLVSLRRQIGIVPQDTALLAGTLRENIAYGRLGASEEEIITAAKQANAWEFIERLPQGLDAPVGERGVTLSGGQRQRIAIARAILRDPRLLILDEATSSLDANSEALVQDALGRLMTHRTTLVIAHRLSTIRDADRILVLREGSIVEEGRHEELLARNGVYADLYRTQYREQEALAPLA